MIPVLYEATENNFKNNGIGKLSDAIVAEVEEAINGVYELFVKYPVNGAFFDEISLRSIIKAKPNTVDDSQAFRVYRITKPINGIVTIYARHLAYDLSGVAVSPFTSQSGVQSALLSLQQNMEVDSPFEFRTTKSGGGEMNVSVPSSAWSLMGGTSGSLLDTYGGEWSYNNYVLTLNSRRGADNGVAIRYGKNLTDLEQDSNCANCYTGVYPYWQFEDEIVTLTEKIIYAEGEFDYTKILPLDLTERFETAPTQEQLRNAAKNYMENNNIGVPDVSWKVEFVALEDTEEYKGKGFLERISLGDTVKVVFDKLGVNASARAVKTVYNVIAERYESITLGRVRSNLAQTIVEQQKEIEKKPNQSLVEKISDSLAATIMGLNGGSVRLLDTNADGEPDTLYIADNPDPAQAVKVWRFNYEGWAASKNGYNGPFIMGATLEDGILANLINVVSLFAENITMTGTFTNTTNAFVEPNQAVVDRINNHLLGTSLIPSSQTSLYDFNNDGVISGSDLVIANSARLGKTSLASWPKAVKTPVTCTINLSNPAKALVMSGTDMWGNYRESVIGVDPATATFVERSLLDSIVTMGASGIMSRSIDGETEYFNPNLFSSQEDAPQEYRTTERWDNSPVYVRDVKYKYNGQLGSTTNETSLDIPHGIPWDSSYQLVRIEATLNRAKVLPHLVSGGGMTIVTGVDNDNINLLVRNDYWNSPEFYFRIYYIKNWVGE